MRYIDWKLKFFVISPEALKERHADFHIEKAESVLTDKVMIERSGDIDNLSVLFSAVFNSVSMTVEEDHSILLMRKGKK